ncbi:putative uncharacterized protein [Firmicutes bacterium CAG:646]|nr:putative uncharacterized protein [Firmicutes bacterium CAG:646]
MITEIEVCTPFFIFDAVCMFISGGALYFTVGKLIEIKNHWWTKILLCIACTVVPNMIIFFSDWANLPPTFLFFLSAIFVCCEGSGLKKLASGNYVPNFLGTSVPEVVEIKENLDDTVTLTVNAVCDMVICNDALITHKLTVKFKEDGSFQYLGNEIWEEDKINVPEYQYRVKGEIKNGS